MGSWPTWFVYGVVTDLLVGAGAQSYSEAGGSGGHGKSLKGTRNEGKLALPFLQIFRIFPR